MNRYLSENSILRTADCCYTIQRLIGRGSSCAVYFARRTEENSGAVTEHIIKEYNPSFMALVRDESGNLIPANDTDDDRERFEQGRERFLKACRRQAELRSQHVALKNSTVNLQHTFDANGTSYADSTSFSGSTYDVVKEESLHAMLCRFRAIAKVVGEYHKAGYLHLDIKPENILALNDTKELVMMFDFDSVVPIAEINGTAMLSCSRSWAAPELNKGDRSSICAATDLYAIGEMLFERIMGRHSSFTEHRSFSVFRFDSKSELFKDTDPRVFTLLTDVFRSTLNSSPARRYSSADELIEVLDKLITLTRPETQYLRSNLPVMNVFFTGRDGKIAEIHEALSQQNVVFLSGMGGIGKSELARHYAMQYRSGYDTVVFAHYQKPAEGDPESGIMRMLTNDQEVSIVNFRRFDDENNAEYFERKLNKLGELCCDSGERVLFILDNMDTMDDADLDRLLSVGCRMIVTTRCDFSEFYHQINVGPIENVRDIFRHYYTSKMDEEQLKAEAEILEYFEYHTLGVELAAKLLDKGGMKPAELMTKLRYGGAAQTGKNSFRIAKDGHIPEATLFDHIRTLFDVSELTDEEKHVMANMSLLTVSGMPKEDFYQLCQLESYNAINNLIESGWIRSFQGNDSSVKETLDFVALHSIVIDVALEQLKKKPERADIFLDRLVEKIKSSERQKSGKLKSNIVAQYSKDMAFVTFLKLAESYKCLNKFDNVLNCYNKALEIYASLNDRENVGIVCLSIAHVYFDQKCYDEALLWNNKALDIFVKFHMHTWMGYALTDIANIYYLYKNKDDDALALLNKALDIQLSLDKKKSVGGIYASISLIYEKMKKYDDALIWADKALDVYAKLNERCHEGMLSLERGKIYYKLKQYSDALIWSNKALDIFVELNDCENVGTAYKIIAHIYHDQKLYDEALVWYNKARDVLIKLNDKETVKGIGMYISDVYWDAGRYLNSLVWYLKSRFLN